MTRTATTAIKMLESLPEGAQEYVVERMRHLIEELQYEFKWQKSFRSSAKKLEKIAKKIHQEMEEGNTEEMDYNKL